MTADTAVRILHVAPGLGTGGVARLIDLLYERLDQSRFRIDVATIPPLGVLGQKLKDAGCDIVEIEPLRDIGPRAYYLQIRRILKSTKYDVIHCHMGLVSLLVFAAAMRSRVPIRILHGHTANGVDVPQSAGAHVAQEIIRFSSYVMATDRIACSSAAARSQTPKMIRRCMRTLVIPNGIDVARFAFDEHSRRETRHARAAKGAFVVGSVGRFSTEKNQKFLIEVFSVVSQHHPNAQLWLVGAGPDQGLLESTCAQLGIHGRVQFVEPTMYVERELAGMDVFVMPSLHEGLGLAVIEAQTCGLPCVVSDGVPREVAFSSNVEFLPLSLGADAWARRILDLGDNVGVLTRHSVEPHPFDADDFCSAVCALYERLAPAELVS